MLKRARIFLGVSKIQKLNFKKQVCFKIQSNQISKVGAAGDGVGSRERANLKKKKRARLNGVRIKLEVVHAGAPEGEKWSRTCPQPEGSFLHVQMLPSLL